MGAFEYTVDDSVAIITMNSDENRFNPTFLKGFLKGVGSSGKGKPRQNRRDKIRP